MIRIKCKTFFDITATGVTGHYKPSRTPNLDPDAWNRARNQQRNWETLNQLINLRTQIMEITNPKCDLDTWTFEFESESNVWDNGIDPLGTLKTDANGIPMLRELDNNPNIHPILITAGPDQNIWFELVPINNVLEN